MAVTGAPTDAAAGTAEGGALMPALAAWYP
jgi:hypothetical protein